MNALSLLMNLHAAGPVSYRLLADDGCHNLEELAERSPNDIAQTLDLTPERAARLLREARSMLERQPRSLLEETDCMDLPFELVADCGAGIGEQAGGFVQEEHEETGTWRKSLTLTSGQPEGETPKTDTTLYPGLLAGLDVRWCEQLSALEIHSLEDLTGHLGRMGAESLARDLCAFLKLQSSAHNMLDTVQSKATSSEPQPEPPPGIAHAPAHGTLIPHFSADHERSLQRYRTMPHPEHTLD